MQKCILLVYGFFIYDDERSWSGQEQELKLSVAPPLGLDDCPEQKDPFPFFTVLTGISDR